MMEYSFQRYLAAKKTVDDRALNGKVWNALEIELDILQLHRSVNILEVGAGIGTMIQRILDKRMVRKARYKAIDELPENIQYPQGYLKDWAEKEGWEWQSSNEELFLQKNESFVQVSLESVDVNDFVRRKQELQAWDLLIANAFLDLFDVQSILPTLRRFITPGGLAYFTINFDGQTEFEPVLDRELEDRIISAYHRSMDERVTNGKPSGDSQTGRHLFRLLPREGFEILEAGSSDWVVYSRDGIYPADEAYFLHHLIHFFEESLQGRPEISQAELAGWASQRHAQIERGELVYIAHQMDFLARVPKRG